MRYTLFALSSFVMLGCSSLGTGSASRGPAQVQEDLPVLKYMSYKDGAPKADVIHRVRWEGTSGGFSAGGRMDYLIKMYSASTRGVSRSGQKHAACFEGHAASVARAFFDKENPNHALPGGQTVRTQPSDDGLMLGIAFSAKQGKKTNDLFFRLPNCNAGKAPIAEDARVMSESAPVDQKAAPVLKAVKAPAIPHQIYGFADTDTAQIAASQNLPRFHTKTDFTKAQPTDNDRPWRGYDARDPRSAFELAVLLQAYIYEGMANQNRNANFNFIAQNSRKRYWCHMPWLNVGVSGREAIHGLTKERDLQPSPTMSLFKNATKGADWGVAYYNSFGCQALGGVFGTKEKPITPPDFSGLNFPDGTFVAKILFTTADFPAIKGAFTWDANVSGAGETERKIQPVRHIQMDIAVKDSAIRGVKSELKDWLMTTYYYDPNYDFDKEYTAVTGKESPLKALKNLPEGFKKMRPMGIQTGLEQPSTGDSIIFAGAETNGFEGRLNGPADNPKSSCLSCHGTAGTTTSMVPGLMRNFEFGQQMQHLDFSQQLGLAKRNIQTYIQTSAGEH